jgi:hypothetical protein
MEKQPHQEYRNELAGVNDSVDEKNAQSVLSLELISQEYVQEISEFCREVIISWGELNPDIIFIGDSRMNSLGIALKNAYKCIFPDRKTRFYRLAPKELLATDLPVSDTFFDDRNEGYPKSYLDEKIPYINKWIKSFTQNVIEKEGKESLKKKKALFFDDSTVVSAPEPQQMVSNGETSMSINTTAGAALNILKSIFDNVWMQSKALPEGYRRYQPYITSGKFRGPRHDEARGEAENYLSDLKKIALASVKDFKREKI